MQSFFLRKHPQIKAAVKMQESAPSTSESEKEVPVVPWHTGMSKRQEEKSQKCHQERVERYHQIHELDAKKVDAANIARQVGVSRQCVYNYLHMQQPPERTRIHPLLVALSPPGERSRARPAVSSRSSASRKP